MTRCKTHGKTIIDEKGKCHDCPPEKKTTKKEV